MPRTDTVDVDGRTLPAWIFRGALATKLAWIAVTPEGVLSHGVLGGVFVPWDAIERPGFLMGFPVLVTARGARLGGSRLARALVRIQGRRVAVPSAELDLLATAILRGHGDPAVRARIGREDAARVLAVA
jgi:hypothetical protein